jgi:hypothetical protein
MKRWMTPWLVCAIAAALLVPAGARAASLFFDYVGFDYEFPNPIPSTFGEPGSGYNGVGFVKNMFAPLAPDTATNQYTYVITGLAPTGSSTAGDYVIINYGPGTISVYEDSKTSGTNADYGMNPPNAISPSSFSDGTLFIQGSLTGFQLVLNTLNGSGSYEAAFTVTGGSQYGNVPANQRTGWTFAGTSANAFNIPAGYTHQIAGQVLLNEPVPSHVVSWGALKARYRP